MRNVNLLTEKTSILLKQPYKTFAKAGKLRGKSCSNVCVSEIVIWLLWKLEKKTVYLGYGTFSSFPLFVFWFFFYSESTKIRPNKICMIAVLFSTPTPFFLCIKWLFLWQMVNCRIGIFSWFTEYYLCNCYFTVILADRLCDSLLCKIYCIFWSHYVWKLSLWLALNMFNFSFVWGY